jgi:hypothetical protein
VNFELDHDLTAWTDGSLSREDLITLHGQEARALVALHERLLGAAGMTAPDPVAGWALLQTTMGAKVVSIRTRPRRRFRRAMLAVAAALLIGGGAFAAIRGGAVDHPGVLSPPAGSPTSTDGPHEQAPGQVGGSSGVVDDRSPGPSSSSAPAGGSGDSTQGSAGSDGTGTSGDGTASGSTDSGGISGGSETQDPDGQHPGQGNGGEDNGHDGPHGHGGASTSTHV